MGSDVPVSTWMHSASLEFGSFAQRNVELIYLLVLFDIIIMNQILLNPKSKLNKLTNLESSYLLLKSPLPLKKLLFVKLSIRQKQLVS